MLSHVHFRIRACTLQQPRLGVQSIAELHVRGSTQAPEDAVQKQASVLVRLDRNGLLRCLTTSMDYVQLKPPADCNVFMHDNLQTARHSGAKRFGGQMRKAWDTPAEREDYPTHTIVRTTVRTHLKEYHQIG